MEVLVQTACIWQAYAVGQPLPETAFRCSVQTDGSDSVSVYIAKQVTNRGSTEPALQRIFHVYEEGEKLWFRSVPLHKQPEDHEGTYADSMINNTSILTCDMTRGLPRWHKFTPQSDLTSCVTVGHGRAEEKYYLGRGLLVAKDQTFAVGTFSPPDGLLVLRSENSTQITNEVEILCSPVLRRSFLSATLAGR